MTDNRDFEDESQPARPQPGQRPESPRIIESDDLLGGRNEVWIRHGDEMYRLRATSSGRLYLSK